MKTIKSLTEAEIAYLPKLPEGWKWVKLGEHSFVTKLAGFEFTKYVTYKEKAEIPVIRAQNVSKIGFIPTNFVYVDRETMEKLPRSRIHGGEILMVFVGSVGNVSIAPSNKEYFLGPNVAKIDLEEQLNNKYVLFFLSSVLGFGNVSGMVKATTQSSISMSNIREVAIPFVALEEQRAIVSKIEQLFSELDNGIANLNLAREQLKVYRQAVLKKAFEGELTKKWREQQTDLPDAGELLEKISKGREQVIKTSGKRQKSTNPLTEDKLAELPSLPEGWGWAKICQVSKVGTGVTPLKKRRDFYEGGTIPWVTSGALNESYVNLASDYVTEVALKETNLKLYPKHTLLVALYGEGKTRGKCSELLIEATTNQAIAAIVQKGTEEKIRPYLKWFFMKNYNEIRMKSSGGVQPNLNLGIIENTSFPLCSLPEQQAIVQEIETRLSVCDKIEQAIKENLEKAEALRQSILKKAFEGKLLNERELAEVRGAEDWEPAEVLLERIKAEKAQNGKKIH